MKWLRRIFVVVVIAVIQLIRNDPRNPYEKLAFDAIYGAHQQFRSK